MQRFFDSDSDNALIEMQKKRIEAALSTSRVVNPTVASYGGGELQLFSHASNWKAYFGSLVAPSLGMRVLEVGAGIGTTTKTLCHGEHERWVCLEPDPEQLHLIEDLILRRDLPGFCEPRLGTIRCISLAEQFDTVLYIDVLEHIRDDRDEVREAASRLVAGGHLVILSPAFDWLMSPFDRSIGHYRRYSRRRLADAIPDGFRNQRLCYLDSIGMLMSLANRTLLRQELPKLWQIAMWNRWIVPISRIIDPLLRFTCGRSVLGVWQKQMPTDLP